MTDIPAHARVCDIVRTPGPQCEALLGEAAAGRNEWTAKDWLAVLAALDICTLTVAQWRAARADPL